jgi:hypothetical protein
MNVPVALIIFNRADTTARVLAEIAKARPAKLLVVADGPRADHPTDAEKCLAARATIDRVDWDCEVLTNYSEVNLGCGARPSSGLNWVFENVAEAIILEDDCLPHPTFFPFCAELLERYRDDERVMMVSGDNFQFGRKRTRYSYYFSRYTHTWGWATWRRAWRYFDREIKLWPALRETPWLLDTLGDERAAEYWGDLFDRMDQMPSVWDYQWAFACWSQSGLTILPNTNLISNIGWGEDATHTKLADNPSANIPTSEMLFPLAHPPYVVRDREADQFTFERLFSMTREMDLSQRVRQKLSGLMPAPMRKSISNLRTR